MTRKEAALEDINIVINELTGALAAANECKAAIVAEDRAKLDEAIIKLDDIDLIDVTSGTICEYLRELEEFDAEGARADERVDRERVEGVMVQ